MKVKTLYRFRDAKEDVIREVGDTFEVTQERFDEIQAVAKEYGTDFIEKVKTSPQRGRKPKAEAE